MSHLAYFIGGSLLGAAVTAAIGLALMREHSGVGGPVNPRQAMILGVCAVVFGLLLGWATNTYISFVQVSAALHG